MDDKNKDVDLYRDTPVRYLGYANEVGESFRNLAPKPVVWLSYVISTGYVIADTVDKGYRMYKIDQTAQKTKRAVLSAADSLIWQTLASVLIPGYTINRICAAVQFAQKRAKSCTLRSPWIPTIVGLISIPFIINPIDNLVEEIMNATYRKWVGDYSKPRSIETKDK